MSNATAISGATFGREVLEANVPALVDFWATWCQPCRQIAPVVDEVAGEHAGRLKVVKVDVDQNRETAIAHGVSSIPTLVLSKQGQAVERLVGFHPKEQLLAAVERHLH